MWPNLPAKLAARIGQRPAASTPPGWTAPAGAAPTPAPSPGQPGAAPALPPDDDDPDGLLIRPRFDCTTPTLADAPTCSFASWIGLGR